MSRANEGAVPRRNRVDLLTPAERAIADAVKAVEAVSPDGRLTQAVILLDRALNHVANYVDEEAAKHHQVAGGAP
jgi:hypothetical protein